MATVQVALPYTLPYSFTFVYPSTDPDRICHVLNTVRSVSVLANSRVFVVPEDG